MTQLFIFTVFLSFHQDSRRDPGLHDFHLSLCEMKYEEQRNALEISLHVFVDDVERALWEEGAGTIHLATEMEGGSAQAFLEQYLYEQFNIITGQNRLQWTYLGNEQTDDFMGMWCYLEIKNVPAVEELSVVNEIHFELFEDQKNILHFSPSGEMRGTLYVHPKDRQKTLPLR